MKTTFSAGVLLLIAVSCSTSSVEEKKSASNKRTYRNPILEQFDMADPDVMKVGKKYYMYPTSHGRGFDVFVSGDLVNWENKGSAFNDPRRGAWAPDLFQNNGKGGDGKFYLYYTDNNTDVDSVPRKKQIGVAVADSPMGPFVDKAVLEKGSIDAHLFQDDDGKFYLYYVNIANGFKIMVQPMSDPVTKMGEATKLIQPTEPWEKISGPVTEGPFILKRKGIYYLMFSGTSADSPNYGLGYATSKSPLGPFVKYAGNPIVKRTGTIFGPGHHCVVEGPDKKLWMVYHQKRSAETSYKRYLAIDPMWFDKDGVIHAKVTKGTDEPAP